MLWFLIPGIAIGLAVIGLAILVVRKFPELVLIDVTTIARERAARVKSGIVAARAERLSHRWSTRLRVAVAPSITGVQAAVKRLAARAAELERRGRKTGVTAGAGEKTAERQTKELMEQAQALARAGKTSEAEAKYIQVISLAPKYVKAYEELGRLYLREKQWKEAEETFRFLLKLDPQDASVLANLGELETARGDLEKALARYRAAVKLKPSNPKYLDLLLEAAIAAGDRDQARETFARLKEANPENRKLGEFETRIREMPAAAPEKEEGMPT